MIKITKDLRSEVPWVKGKSREAWKRLLVETQSCIQSPCRQKLVEIIVDPEQNQTHCFYCFILFYFISFYFIYWLETLQEIQTGFCEGKIYYRYAHCLQVNKVSCFIIIIIIIIIIIVILFLFLFMCKVSSPHTLSGKAIRHHLNQKDVNFLQVHSLLIDSTEAASAEAGTHLGRK